jgi:hypothetical protein
VTDVLSQRGLNRATLARQYLLERAPAPAIDAIEQLGGMQSQAPLAPYVGLWTRLQGFAPDELSALTEEHQVIRLHLMRNTVHLVSARATAWAGARCSIRCTPPSSVRTFAAVPREWTGTRCSGRRSGCWRSSRWARW